MWNQGHDWFSENPQPDLIFSDIQLGDGMAFDIFNKIELTCPVIFCTAYDEYAIHAFRNNGIDYLLKPVDEKMLEKSLAKIDLLKKPVSQGYDPFALYKVLKDIEQNTKKTIKTVSWFHTVTNLSRFLLKIFVSLEFRTTCYNYILRTIRYILSITNWITWKLL